MKGVGIMSLIVGLVSIVFGLLIFLGMIVGAIIIGASVIFILEMLGLVAMGLALLVRLLKKHL